MTPNFRWLANSALIVSALIASPAAADKSAADIVRSVHLRQDWEYLTENVADPAIWAPGSPKTP